jgi:hypothetical protein
VVVVDPCRRFVFDMACSTVDLDDDDDDVDDVDDDELDFGSFEATTFFFSLSL